MWLASPRYFFGWFGRSRLARIGAALLFLSGTTLRLIAYEMRTDFSADPFGSRPGAWSIIGDAQLFRWNSDTHQLDVTWDSSRPNSFCVWPLPYSVSAKDAFRFGWTLTLRDAGARESAVHSNVLQISVALLQQARLPDGYPQRTRAGRASELLDFSFFPLADYGPFGMAAYISPVAFGKTTAGYSFGNSYNLADGLPHPIICEWDSSARRLRTTVAGVGDLAPTDPPLPVTDDFSVDAFAIIVWNEGPTPNDSLLAHGSIGEVVINLPEPAVGRLKFEFTSRTIRFSSRANYVYALEASGDLIHWSPADGPVAGNEGELALIDSREALFPLQFYRVRATPRP